MAGQGTRARGGEALAKPQNALAIQASLQWKVGVFGDEYKQKG